MTTPIQSSFYLWDDGRSVGCYVWTNDSDIKTYVIDVEKALFAHPNLGRLQAVKQVAIDTFKIERRNAKET